MLNKKWDEMRASYMDFPRVLAEVKKTVLEVLGNVNSIENFQRLIFGATSASSKVSCLNYLFN